MFLWYIVMAIVVAAGAIDAQSGFWMVIIAAAIGDPDFIKFCRRLEATRIPR